MGKVRLTPRAESDLFKIWTTIAADNFRAADGVIQRIMLKVELAADQPLMVENHPDRTLPNLGRKLLRCLLAVHSPILSRVGASGKPGAVH